MKTLLKIINAIDSPFLIFAVHPFTWGMALILLYAVANMLGVKV